MANANIEPIPTKKELETMWLTPMDVEKIYKISVSLQEKFRSKSCRQSWIKQGKKPIPFSKFGHFVRYYRPMLDEWILGNYTYKG